MFGRLIYRFGQVEKSRLGTDDTGRLRVHFSSSVGRFKANQGYQYLQGAKDITEIIYFGQLNKFEAHLDFFRFRFL